MFDWYGEKVAVIEGETLTGIPCSQEYGEGGKA
jgi:hypothetical protein